jgi:hypothetical protein
MNKSIIKKQELIKAIHVAVEPGDLTRYDFLISKDGPNNFVIAPVRSTFKFPQRISRFDVPSSDAIENWLRYRGGNPKNRTSFDDYVMEIAKIYNCNPCAVAAVIDTIKELIEKGDL